MKILICTGIYPPDVGGPAKYAYHLAQEFGKQGHEIKVLAYKLEKKMPIGLRHLYYFFRVLANLWRTDLIIVLDMLSTGFPAVLAGKLFNKKTILRVGGDFLWETYTDKTGNLIKLKYFYQNTPKLSFKFSLIKKLQKFTLENARVLVFNSNWQKNLFNKYYNLNNKLFVVENYYGEKSESKKFTNKNFLFAGRQTKFKNLKLVQEVFEELKKEGSEAVLEIVDNLSDVALMEKIKNSYALLTLSITDFAPNFIVEGIMAGKPFILTKDCGLVERVGELGIIVEPIDKNEVKIAIKSLLDNNVYNNYCQKISNFNFVHSWEILAKEFLQIYKNV